METFATNTENSCNPVKYVLTWEDVEIDVVNLVCRIKAFAGNHTLKIYGIPRGGIPVAIIVQSRLANAILVDTPEEANIFIDDITDSGATQEKWLERYPNVQFFFSLIDKRDKLSEAWYVFPWEAAVDETSPTENIRRCLEYIGEDVKREGLLETPERVVKSWNRLYGGYRQNVKDVLKVFENDTSDEMVVLKDIEFYSTCEHHMLPFFGKAHIAYIPSGKVVGISKLARILEVYARRLQIQERLCQQITGALMEYLQPKGAACVLEAQHFCMTSRGVEKQNSLMVTSSLTGVFRDTATRAEFMQTIRG